MTPGQLPLSAVIISLNESNNIARCVKSVRFCSETIVVDSGSADGTREIAAQHGAKVHQEPWRGFVAQKNLAVSLATQPWVLSIDADEEVTPELEGELRALFAAGPPLGARAFELPRKTIHFGRWIRHGGWYPNYLTRLFDPTAGQWEGGELHEYWVTRGEVARLKSPLHHYSFRDLADQVARNNRYSSLGARQLRQAGKRFSPLRLFTKPTSKFLETYLWKRGFLDGFPGFIISVSAAYSVFLKWAKLWELEHGEDKA